MSVLETVLKVEWLAVGSDNQSLIKSACSRIEFSLEGILGDKHAGFHRAADARDLGVKRGTRVRNWRQWSAISTFELKAIAKELAIDELDPALLGANLVFSGCDNLTQIPKGSQLWFPSDAVLTVEGENAPCIGPGKEIAKRFPLVKAAHFPRAASHRRGLVGVVYRAGTACVGDAVRLGLYEPYDALPKPPGTS